MVGFNTLFTSSLDKPWGDPLPALERIHRSLRTFLSSNLWRGHREHGRVLVELPPCFAETSRCVTSTSTVLLSEKSLDFYPWFFGLMLDIPSKITSKTGSCLENPWEGSGCWQLSKKVCLRRPSCGFAYVNVNLWVSPWKWSYTSRIFYSKHV